VIEDDELQRMCKEAAMPYFEPLYQNFPELVEEIHGKPHSGRPRIETGTSQMRIRTTTFGTYQQCMM
jgi:hypothetical protein